MNKQSLGNRGNLKNTNSIAHRSSNTDRLTITRGETDALVCSPRGVWSSKLFWKWPPSCHTFFFADELKYSFCSSQTRVTKSLQSHWPGNFFASMLHIRPYS